MRHRRRREQRSSAVARLQRRTDVRRMCSAGRRGLSCPEVSDFISRTFVPARAHVKEQQDVFERSGAQWTPTILVLDEDGKERHRIEGFLPKDDFLAQLRIGITHAARARLDWKDAEGRYRALAEPGSDGDVASESLYWAGVSRYKATGDAAALADTAADFQKRFPDSTWAKKASVWSK